MAAIRARLFDGHSSRPLPVRLSAVAGGVDLEVLDGSAPRERLAPADLHWHEPLGRAVRRVDLPGGRHCEVVSDDALAAFCAPPVTASRASPCGSAAACAWRWPSG